jgi:hypothetical protein
MAQTATVKDQTIREQHRSLEHVRERILAYESEMKDYLEHLNANIEYYKFSVEKHGDGISVEVSMKATVRPKPAEAATV